MRAFILAAVLAVVGACSAAPPSTTADAQDPCASAEQMQAFVVAFLAEYNVGRIGQADRFFAPDPAFQWYSERPLRQGSPAFQRSSLESYLQQRHADGDMLTLVSLETSGVREQLSANGQAMVPVGNFGFMVRRSTVEFLSKGAIDCRSRKFIVWSLGPDPGPTP